VALLASAWVGANNAYAQDDEGEQAPPPEQAEDKPPAPPDTHMCEAAPPPWDLYKPPPPPNFQPFLRGIEAVETLRKIFTQRCSASVSVVVDEQGVATEIKVITDPETPELQVGMEEALEGVVFPEHLRGQLHKAALWRQVIPVVREVEPDEEE